MPPNTSHVPDHPIIRTTSRSRSAIISPHSAILLEETARKGGAVTESPDIWICAQCGADVEDSFDACWQCGADRDGTPATEAREPDAPSVPTNIRCRACGYRLDGLDAGKCPECSWPFDPPCPGRCARRRPRPRVRHLRGGRPVARATVGVQRARLPLHGAVDVGAGPVGAHDRPDHGRRARRVRAPPGPRCGAPARPVPSRLAIALAIGLMISWASRRTVVRRPRASARLPARAHGRRGGRGSRGGHP